MDIYKVNHNGSCRSEETGRIHSYHAGVPVELPEDVVAALGAAATLVEKAKPEVKEESEAKEHKEVKKAPKDKMIKGAEVTK